MENGSLSSTTGLGVYLYHASDRVIKMPDIHRGRKNADFGQGFYLTPDKEFALRWAGEGAVVNEYIFDSSGLEICSFSREKDWFDYIFQNRRAADRLDADVIIGPVANDTLYDTFGIITSGFLSPDEALRLLLIGPEYTQYAIKSQKAANQLKWTAAHTVEDCNRYRDLVKEEEQAYQELFAEEMQRMT